MKSMNAKGIMLGLASAAFVLPSFILTVFFQAEQDWHNGTFGVITIGMAVFMVMSVSGLPFIPFALKRAEGMGPQAFLALMFLAMLSVNYSNSLDALNKIYTLTVGGMQNRITEAAALRNKIAELEKVKIAEHAYVGPGEVDAAKSAVASAEKARDAECKVVASRCRDREDKVAEETSKLKSIQRDRALTEKAERTQGDLVAARDDLAKLGHVPETADATAAQLAHILGALWSLTPDSVSSNRPAYTAFVIELMGAGMPLVLFLTFADAVSTELPVPAPAPTSRPVRLPRTRPSRSKPEVIEEMQADVKALFAPVEEIPVRKTIAAGKGGKIVDTGHLAQWWDDCVVASEGSRFQNKVFRQSYEDWCRGQRPAIKPVGPNPFGTFIIGEIGEDAREKDRGYTFYHGIKPKLATLQKVG